MMENKIFYFLQKPTDEQLTVLCPPPIHQDFEIKNGVLLRYTGKDKAVQCPEGITKIAAGAFLINDEMESVHFPQSLRVIKRGAFLLCSKLSQVSFNNGLEKIESRAFCECENLKWVDILDTVAVSSDAFDRHTRVDRSVRITVQDLYNRWKEQQKEPQKPNKLMELTDKEFEIENGVLNKYTGTDRLVAVPLKVKRINRWAFAEKQNLEEVFIPDSVSMINAYAFSDCRSLSDVYMLDSITEIGVAAFIRCYSLKNIRIPSKVKVIQRLTFAWCSNLESILLPKDLELIESGAFHGCKKLKSLLLPKKAKVAQDAFTMCQGLKIIYY